MSIRKPYRFRPATALFRELKKYKREESPRDDCCEDAYTTVMQTPQTLFDFLPREIREMLTFFLLPEERFIVKSLSSFKSLERCSIDIKDVKLVDYSIEHASFTLCSWALSIKAPYDDISVMKAYMKTSHYQPLHAPTHNSDRIFEKLRYTQSSQNFRSIESLLETFRSYMFLVNVIKQKDTGLILSAVELGGKFTDSHMTCALRCNNVKGLYTLLNLDVRVPFELAYESARCGNVEALKFSLTFSSNLNAHVSTCCTESDSLSMFESLS